MTSELDGWLLVKIVILILCLLGVVAYLTYAERRVIGWMQARRGPNRVGPFGLLQPIADTVKLLCKEIIIPRSANRYLFLTAPVLAIGPAFAAWAVIPFSSDWVISDIDIGLLFLLAMTSIAVYGIIIAGWASNSKYALLGALRQAAQMVSYEIAMGFALVGVVMASGTTRLQAVVLQQAGGLLHWYWIPLLPLCVIYWIAAVAETNRLPFDVAEGESELVAGFHVEYAGMGFALFFLAEYANMILVSGLSALLFFGGWLSPLEGLSFVPLWLQQGHPLWFLGKIACFLFLFLWFRATFPRYRFDHIMRLGWKIYIPITLVWLVILAGLITGHVGPWFS